MNINFKKGSIEAIICFRRLLPTTIVCFSRLLPLKIVYFSRLMLILILMMTIMRIQPTDAISDKNLVWAGGDVYSLSPSSNMATEGIYTIKALDFPRPVRGTLSVNDTIIPVTPVTLAVTLELYKDIINNSNPIATFTLRPGDEYITNSQDLRVTIDSMPDKESADWIYESYNPSANIRLQQAAAPDMSITITFTDSNGNSIDTINSGDQFLVDIKVQNTGTDVATNLIANITPDPAFRIVKYPNKSQSYISKLDIDDQFSNQMTLVAPIIQGLTSYPVNVNISATDPRGLLYNWNSSASISVNGSLNLLQLNKFVSKTTVYLQDYIHVDLNVYNRGPIPIDNIHIDDAIPYNLKLIQNNTETSLKAIRYDKNSLGPDQSWDISYLLKPIQPGTYVLPAFTASFTMQGARYNIDSNEEGFIVYGPIVQLNKSAMYEGYNVVEVNVAAKNIGNGPTTIIIHDVLPDNTVLLSGTTNISMSLDANEEKIMNYTISIPQFKSINMTNWPAAEATYFLADYKFRTTSNEKIIEETPPVPISTGTPIISAPAPTIQETEKIPVATIPINGQTPKSAPGFDIYEVFVPLLILIIYKISRPPPRKHC